MCDDRAGELALSSWDEEYVVSKDESVPVETDPVVFLLRLRNEGLRLMTAGEALLLREGEGPLLRLGLPLAKLTPL